MSKDTAKQSHPVVGGPSDKSTERIVKASTVPSDALVGMVKKMRARPAADSELDSVMSTPSAEKVPAGKAY